MIRVDYIFNKMMENIEAATIDLISASYEEKKDLFSNK